MREPRKPRPFIGMLFKCCQVYTRVYLNADGSAYAGRCPRCGGRITVAVAEGGSSSRFWSAG